MLILADVVLTTETVAVVGLILAAMQSAIVALWLTERQYRREERDRLNDQVQQLLAVLIRNGLRDEVPRGIPPSKLPPRE